MDRISSSFICGDFSRRMDFVKRKRTMLNGCNNKMNCFFFSPKLQINLLTIMRIRAMQAYGADNLIKHRNPYNAIKTFQANVSIPLENRKANVF